ncbi:MAG: PAS domain S-box protein, partial [Candidatus Hydrogenedentes bacterium]|nr:PAS domain S-box protein [Candidatus Hydrogenedentota bacterium]
MFSTRWDDPVLHRITLLLSVALPVFGVGNFLARLHVTGLQKLLLLAGVLMLIVGGMATIADFPGTFGDSEEIPAEARDMARWVGALGLAAGMIAILFAVVRGEEELAEIGDRFRYLTDHMSEGFILSGPDGTVLLVNRYLLDMIGLKQDEVVGRNAHEMVKELNHPSIMDHLEERKQRRASEYVITHEVNDEERHFAVTGTPIFNRRGEHAGTVAIFRDVTEQVELSRSLEKYAEGLQRLVEEQTYQLRESEGRLRGLLLHMNEGFLTLDTGFRVRFANERICEMLGLEAGDLVGRDIFGLVEPAGRAKLLNLLKMAGSNKTTRLQQETSLVTQGRGPTPVVLGVSGVEDSREGGVRYSLVVTDVSQQKEMQRQLEQRAIQLESANEELRILDRSKDSFLTNVTHELRTPLSTIRGYVEMLDSEGIGVLDKEQKDALRVITRNVQRLGTLIEEMIEFSRMQMRGFRLKFTLFKPE